jgi:hypothetical protein
VIATWQFEVFVALVKTQLRKFRRAALRNSTRGMSRHYSTRSRASHAAIDRERSDAIPSAA